ncbi:hypothetical protein MKW94_030853, partial [Papaver nudicaule]|nr:hypothetical protein [Papaver nudicaule]
MAEASTSSSPDELFAIPDEFHLTLDNYEIWKLVMCQSLEQYQYHLWRYLSTRQIRVDLCKDRKVLEAIKKSCSAEMLPHVMYVELAREAWFLLEQTAAWTEEEKDNYKSKVKIAARARLNSQDVPEVDKILTQHNYRKWKVYMENILISKYLWTIVDGSEGDTFRSRSYKIKNHTASVIIRMSCGEEMFLYIDDEDNAHDAWCKLKGKLEDTASIERGKDSVITTLELDSNELLWVAFSDNKPHTSSSNYFSSNYETWKVRMETYLRTEDLWGFLEERVISDHAKDNRALDAIKVSCSPEMQAYILYINSAKRAWEKLASVARELATEPRYSLHLDHCEMVNEAERNREYLLGWSEADKVLTRNNYQIWEEYVTILLRSLFLYDVVLPNEHRSYRGFSTDYEIKEACALRTIKEACGREMMPYIFRSNSPEEAFNSLRNACTMDQKDDYMKYSRLLHAVQKNGFQEQIRDRNGEIWRGAHKFFRDFPEALAAEITEDGSTALHVAVRLGRVDFVRELLELMTEEQSELKTHLGNTAIAVAAGGNNMEIIKMLIESNPHLPIIGNENELHAVTIAAINGNETIMRYLYPLTSKSTVWWGARSVASFLTSAARLDAFDVVEDLLSHFPDYALVRDDYGMCTLLSVLAEKPSAFPSGHQFGLLGGWIYQLEFSNASIFFTAGSKTHETVLKALRIIVPGVKQVLNGKEKHDHTAVIVQQICSLLPNLNPQQLKESFINDAIHRSIIHGTVEVFEILVDTNPYLEHFKDENGRGLFQISIINRQESIFQYMSQMGQRNQDMALLDNFDNNALHCAALWDSSSQLVHSPALQMQREIQWFQ